MRYALVESSGKIRNVAVWDGQAPWRPGDELVVVPDPDGLAAPGGAYRDGAFSPPPPPGVAAKDRLAEIEARLAALEAGAVAKE